ncbi:hypothetical protein AB1Y20_009902 [Prymnesium parvum]|uniref:BSD domain-containing protein n=1 Tax=Prymnesium parvum TaxID=97485 RepID=A0AB34K3D6_PRYPA
MDVLFEGEVSVKQAPGRLRLTTTTLEWFPDRGGTTIRLPYERILKSQPSKQGAKPIMLRVLMKPPDQEKHTFNFSTEPEDERGSCERRARVLDTLLQCLEQPAEESEAVGMNDPEEEARAAELAASAELRALYETVVEKSGSLTAEEFWAQRREVLRSKLQQPGFTGKRLAAGQAPLPKPQMSIKLTAAEKQRIFTETPEVQTLFFQKVPHEMSEKVFWSRYYRLKSKHESSRAGSSSSLAGKNDALVNELLGAAHKPARAELMYPDTNLEAGDEVRSVRHRGGYGTHSVDGAGGALTSGSASVARDVMSQYNTHGRVVVLGHVASTGELRDKLREDARRSWVQIPDLEPPKETAYQPLPSQLADPARRFGDVAATSGGEAPLDPQQIHDRALRLSKAFADACKQHEGKPLVRASREAAVGAAKRITRRSSGTISNKLLTRTLAPDEEQHLREKLERAVELLRFFYGCFPLTQPGAVEKASRISLAIGSLQAEIGLVKQALPKDNPAISLPVLARLDPLAMLLTCALARYDEEQKKHQARVGA